MESIEDFTSRISNAYGGMSPNYRKIAAFILDHPDEVAMASTRQIASRLEMDPSNLVRFAKDYSFSGFRQLKELFQDQLRNPGTGYLERAKKLQKNGSNGKIDRLLSEIHNANTANISEVFEKNSPQTLSEAGGLIMNAKHVFLYGFRSCFPAAFALHYTCRMVRGDVYLSDGLGGTLADDMRNIGKGDVFVTIGMEPYTKSILAAARFAKDNGATVMALTDSVLSPLAEHAQLVLTFSRKGPLVLGSIIPAIALVESLSTLMIAEGGTKAISALQKSEKQLAEFAAYTDQS